MEDRTAEVTVRVMLPLTLPWVAAMVTAPAATEVAKPLALIVTTDEFDQAQVTCVVISKLVPSE